MMRKIVILLLLFFSLESMAQSVYERQLKYWYLRDRLRHFVVPSNDPLNERGTFLVIGSRNNNWPENHWWTERASYGQQMEYYGYYIGVLATEYYLLMESGKTEEAANTNAELLYALKAYKRRDLCEELLDPPLPNTLDGFFIRSDVPEDDLFNEDPPQNSFLLNSDLNNENPVLISSDPLLDENESIRVVNYTSNLLPNHIQYEKMSQDEAVFLLEGLALTYKFGGSEARIIAREYAHIVLHRMFGSVSPSIHYADWVIRDPYGNPMTDAQGGICRGLSYGYTKTALDFFGFTGFFPFPGSETLWALSWNGPISGYNAHMIASIAAISNGWGSLFHRTQHGIYNNTDQDGWDYYYLWLYKALWDDSWSLYDVDRIEDRLDEAPCEGPYCESFDNLAPNGWASTDRWRESKDLQDGERIGDVGIYTGLDYMILFNLYFINNVEDRTLYKNYSEMQTDQIWPNNGLGSINNPYSLETFRSIISSDRLENDPQADITYKAGVNILLLPGFQVQNGAHFIANISSMDYCSTPPPIRKKRMSYPPISFDNSTLLYTSVNDWNENIVDNLDNPSVNIIENNIEDVTICPNPSTGIFTILNNNSIDYFEIYSLNGHIIKKGKIKDNSFTIDLSSFSNGIFTLILFSEEQTYIKKLSLIK